MGKDEGKGVFSSLSLYIKEGQVKRWLYFFFVLNLFLMQHSSQKFPRTILILYQSTNMALPTSIKHPSAEFRISAELCNNVPLFQPCKISHCGRPQ